MPAYKTLFSCLSIISVFLLPGCTGANAHKGYFSKRQSNLKIIDSGVMLLQRGDLVLRRGRDVASYMVSRCNVQDMTYSHCGLVQIEHGYPFVYHSIDGEQNSFGLQRDSAVVFFSPVNNSAVSIMRYALDSQQLVKQSELIQQYYQKKTSFDRDFDLGTSDKLYCTELVYRVMNNATNDTSFIKTTIKKGVEYVSVDNIYMNGRTTTIWQKAFK